MPMPMSMPGPKVIQKNPKMGILKFSVSSEFGYFEKSIQPFPRKLGTNFQYFPNNFIISTVVNSVEVDSTLSAKF